eukprot:SM000086S23030  [mRNA]  locus=s86:120558:121855:- [translate_table: standard]
MQRKERALMEAKLHLESMAAIEADQDAADALVDEVQRDVEVAAEELRQAALALIKARAGRSFEAETPGWVEFPDLVVDKRAERLESAKAAALAAAAGGAISLPFTSAVAGADLFSPAYLLSEAAVVITCLLFGVTYRYVLRRDLRNTQLKAGAVGAFAMTRGLAQVDTTQLLVGYPSAGTELVYAAALNAGESLIILAFAATAVEYAMQQRLVKPFPATRD